MTHDSLYTYLNDHLAGSVGALELIEHLASTAESPEDRQFFVSLREEIAASQQVLRGLLHEVGGTESRIRKAGAWLGEKFGELKLRMDDPAGVRFRRFEALETLALGIQGQLALWLALEQVRDRIAPVRELDLRSLQARARDQHARVEARRLAAARECLELPK